MARTDLKKIGYTHDRALEELQRVVSNSYSDILDIINKYFDLDTKNENFLETPARVGRAFCEMLSGIHNKKEKINQILKTRFPGTTQEMLVCGPVHVWSLCPHHFLPVEMNIWVGYIANKEFLGLSKLARLAQVIAAAPAMQEDTTNEIAQALFGGLECAGAACHIQGRHLCMAMRGARQDSVFRSTSLKGVFTAPEVKSEFLGYVGGKNAS